MHGSCRARPKCGRCARADLSRAAVARARESGTLLRLSTPNRATFRRRLPGPVARMAMETRADG
eukprot:5706113-Pleurochrysis_carterae.AAC.2